MRSIKTTYAVWGMLTVACTFAVVGMFTWRTLLCKLNDQCLGTAFGLHFTYPAEWRVKRTDFYEPDGSKRSGFEVYSLFGGTPVSIGEVRGTLQKSNSQAVSTEQLIVASRLPGLLDAWDVRVVDEVRYGSNDSFIPSEFIMSGAVLHQRGLQPGSMVSIDSFVLPRFVSGNKTYLAGASGQQVYSNLANAQAWFATPDAQAAHGILTSLRTAR